MLHFQYEMRLHFISYFYSLIMNNSVQIILILVFYFHLCSLFEIEIKRCHTRDNESGLCREASECVDHRPNAIDSSCECGNGRVCCPAGFISERRCFQYSRYVYSKHSGAMTFSAFGDEADEIEDDCGSLGSIPLIIGGVKAEKKEFPHMAALGYESKNGQIEWGCGGSLISETYILTAAHCVVTTSGEPKHVKLGVNNIERDEGGQVQLIGVKRTINHPRYDASSQTHDLALVETDQPVNFSSYVRPACLDFTGVFPDEHFVATGWGWDETGEPSPDLMKVQISVIDRQTCQRHYDGDEDDDDNYYRRVLTDSQICAGDLKGGKDACRGDSGGPLQTLMTSPYCMFSVIGVTSFGSFCGFKDSSGVYTRVFSFVPWIENIVWPDD